MRPRIVLTALFGLLPAMTPPVAAQDVLEQIRALSDDNAEAYARPLAEGLNQVISGGFVDRARPMNRFGFDLSFRILAAVPGVEHKTFDALVPDSVRWDDRVFHTPYQPHEGDGTTPTIAGDGAGAVFSPAGEFREALVAAGQDPDQAGFRLVFPSGLGLPAVPLVVFQGSVGVGFGTEVSLRFLPAVEISPEVGRVRSHGLSVQHAVTHWVPAPVDLLVTLGLQDASAGDYLESTSTSLGFIAGVSAGPMSLTGGAILREATTEISYRLENLEGNPGLPADGIDLMVRSQSTGDPSYMVGARLQLLALNLSGHYLFGSYRVFSLKLGLGIP
jgi:hypothetical protein